MTIHIDPEAIRRAGGEPTLEGARLGGWTVRVRAAGISSDAEMEQVRAELGAVTLPEQYFGSSAVELLHEPTGTSISFTAQGALASVGVDAPPRLQVKAARKWLAAHRDEADAHDAKVLEYDWTFTTGYRGNTVSVGGAGEEGGREGGRGDKTPAKPAGPAGGSADAAARARVPLCWKKPVQPYDRKLLLTRDPILLFGAVTLYESELEDNGVASATVRVRVMPKCWLVLFRFFLRVDGVAARVRETRVYCELDPTSSNCVVTRETTHSEGTFAEMRAAGAPASDQAYSDGDSAAAAFAAAAPACVRLYEVEGLELRA